MARTRLTDEDISGSLAELVEQLGSIPLHRIRTTPPPGMATEGDVLALKDRSGRLYELIDGTLVEKATGTRESLLATLIGQLLGNHVPEHDLGVVLGEGGYQRLAARLVRIPDVSFIPWGRWPEEREGEPRILSVYPDLAVEVLSESNTAAEIDRKLRELFFAGMKVAWVLEPQLRTARVYTAPDEFTEVPPDGTLDAAPAIPGFKLSMADLFARTRPRKGDTP